MRSAISRRLVFSVLSVVAIGGLAPLAGHVVYMAVAHIELARLNEERNAQATLDQDSMTPINLAKSQDLIRRLREASERADARALAAN